MHKGLLLVVGMFLAANVATGCSAEMPPSDSADITEPPIGQLLNVTDLRTFVLPLDPYLMWRENLLVTQQAEPLLIRRCVARFGFDYPTPPPPNPIVIGKERRYGIADAERAAVWGYHHPPRAPSPDYVEPAGELLALIVGEGRSSYGGQQVPEGGCVGEARRKLAENAPNPPNENLANDLASESFSRARGDSRVRKATESWSACMKRTGYDYAAPMDANNDPALKGDVASPQEINVAVADVRCKKESNYINIIATVETAYQKRALERNAAALAVIKANFDAREREAAKVVAGQ